MALLQSNHTRQSWKEISFAKQLSKGIIGHILSEFQSRGDILQWACEWLSNQNTISVDYTDVWLEWKHKQITYSIF